MDMDPMVPVEERLPVTVSVPLLVEVSVSSVMEVVNETEKVSPDIVSSNVRERVPVGVGVRSDRLMVFVGFSVTETVVERLSDDVTPKDQVSVNTTVSLPLSKL